MIPASLMASSLRIARPSGANRTISAPDKNIQDVKAPIFQQHDDVRMAIDEREGPDRCLERSEVTFRFQ